MPVIIAHSIISPLGIGTEANYRAVRENRSGIRRYEGLWNIPEPFAASLLEGADFDSLCLQALQVAVRGTDIELRSPHLLLILASTKGLIGTPLGDSARRLQEAIGNPNTPLTICNACVSGTDAQIEALRYLEVGLYDRVAVVGADVMTKFIVSGFQSLKVVSDEPCRPFDGDRFGLNPGDAAACIIYEREGLSSGNYWKTDLHHTAIRNDACHISQPSRTGEGCYQAIRTALCGLNASELGVINAHGTATMYNDEMEATAIHRAGLDCVPVNGLKGYYGHTMGAAGVLETILTLRALDDGIVLGTRNFAEQGTSHALQITSKEQTTDKRTALKIISGFGGANAAMLFWRTPEPPATMPSKRIYQTIPADATPHRPSRSALSKRLLSAAPKEAPDCIVLFSHEGCMDADRQYLDTLQDSHYFPSPSLFVYTLPNIVTGELAIHYGRSIETSLILLPERDEQLMQRHVQLLLQTYNSVLWGWMEDGRLTRSTKCDSSCSRVFITGYGVISAIGTNKQETLQALQQRRSGIGPLHHLATVHPDLPCGEVPLSNEKMREVLKVPQDAYTNRSALLGAWALHEALLQAGLSDTQEAWLINGTTVGGMDQTEAYWNNTDELAHHMPQHTCGGTTHSMMQIAGTPVRRPITVSTACSSAANAILLAAEVIRTGQADLVIAGGTEALTGFHLNGFNALMILDQEPCRPFDANRAGLNLGEGAAFFVLESEQHAKARGANLLAQLAGAGNACDAFHQTATSEQGEGATRAMLSALQQAGLKTEHIDYINAHGTGTPNNDATESFALRRVFGTHMPPVSSTKAFTGHTTSASGAIEAAICLLAIEHQFLPAQLNFCQPMADGIHPTRGAEHAPVRYVMSNSFGFGGNDTCLIFASPELPGNTQFFKNSSMRMAAQRCLTDARLINLAEVGISPMESRRMGTLMKAALYTSLCALKDAGVTSPDAIIIGTDWGMWDFSRQLLDQMMADGEHLKPSLFMQSTHNTLAGTLAIRTRCHGYNITFSNGEDTRRDVMDDARRLICTGQAQTVLVGWHDEKEGLLSEAIVLKADKA